MVCRYVIIGSGVAGLSAAEVIRRCDPSGEVTLVGDDPHGYYSRPGLAYYLNKAIPERQLFPYSDQYLRDLFPNRIHARVTELLPDSHEISLHDGRRLRYDRLLLATGSEAVPGDFPGHDLAGVVNLNTLEDVRRTLTLVRRDRKAVVVGGGVTAIELVEGLAAHSMCVHYFLRTDRFWSSVLDETESRLVEHGLEEEGVQLHYLTQVAQALGKKGVLAAVVTKAGDTIPCHVLGVAVGVRPRMKLAQQAGLATDKGILVDEYLETSASDVYAAGDIAQVRDSRTGSTWRETLWPVARRQGQIAGANMTGDHATCTRGVFFNTARIASITMTTIGVLERSNDPNLLTVIGSSSDSAWEGPETRVVGNAERANHVRILVGDRTIVGAVVMGDQSMVRPLQELIEAGADITSLRAVLQENPARSIDLIANWHSEWEAAGAKAQQ